MVLQQLLYAEPFRLHAALPQFWHGGFEALVLIATLGVLQFGRLRGRPLAIWLLLAEPYLSARHAVDAVAFVDLPLRKGRGW
jgi:hypothetical protein